MTPVKLGRATVVFASFHAGKDPTLPYAPGFQPSRGITERTTNTFCPGFRSHVYGPAGSKETTSLVHGCA